MLSLASATLFYLSAAVVWLAAARPEYSHLRDTISQLGESGAPRARWTSYAVFFPVGLALSVVAYRTVRLDPNVALLACCLAIGYLGAAFFPCDPGAPNGGTWRQRLHNTCGRLQYLGSAYALYRCAAQHGPLTWAPAVVTVLAAAVSFVPQLSRVRGLIQRVAELTLFISLVLAIARSEN